MTKFTILQDSVSVESKGGKMKRFAFVIAVLFLAGLAFSDVPHLISYQGLIVDDITGDPVPDGGYPITFRLFDVETGGSEIWSESYPSVTVTGGLYSVMLGSMTAFPFSVDFSERYWLEVVFDGTTLSPRYELGASPYALNISDSVYNIAGYVFGDGYTEGCLAQSGLSLPSGEIVSPTRDATAVYGFGDFDVGVYGYSDLWEGVIGYSTGDDGVQGVSTSGSYAGVHGMNTSGTTVEGYLGFNGYGIYTPHNAYISEYLQLGGITSAPSPGEGKIYYNSTDKTAYLFDGSVWQNLVGGSAGPHNHWGETWSGTGSGLTLESTGGTGHGLSVDIEPQSTDGSMWLISASYNAVVGLSTGSEYSAGVYGYCNGMANNSGGVVGAFSSVTWGGLGYVDGSGSVWGGYFSGDVNIDGDLTVTGSYPGGISLWNDGGTYIEPVNNTNVSINDAGATFDLQVNGTSSTGASIYGFHTASGAGERYGVLGSCGSLPAGSGTNYGVKGSATGGTINYAVYGDVGGNPGYGVYGTGGAGKPFGYLGGQDYGVYGEGSVLGAASTGHSIGYFKNTVTSSDAAGVYAECANTDYYGYGGYFKGGYYGVKGEVAPTGDLAYYGVEGYVHSVGGAAGDNYGVYGIASGSGMKYGVYGVASGLGTNHGVYGDAMGGTTNWAGYFNGNVNITGSISKGSGSFLIDHPDDPLNKTLRHNFVESPENLCLYRGKAKLDANGEGIVEMPSYFKSLTEEDEASINLTPVGKPFPTGCDWNDDFTAFTVYGEPGREVYYIVLADRDDPVMRELYRPVEETKGENNGWEKGKLLYPEAYGYPEEMGVDYSRNHKQEK